MHAAVIRRGPAGAPPRRAAGSSRRRDRWRGLAGLATCVVLAGVWIAARPEPATPSPAQLQREASRLQGEVARLRQSVERKQSAMGAPATGYIVVDTQQNRLLLRTSQEVLLDAVCSTGSGRQLQAGSQTWVFETPKGRFRVLAKTRYPVWVKPDWAFYEEGRRPPLPRSRERYEEGVLGEYSLSLGDGYLIHGTLFTRLLGQSVTHGCIRLGDEDLATLYQRAPVGTLVYII